VLKLLRPGPLAAWSVIVLAGCYAVWQRDAFVIMGMMPFVLLGCAKGKKPAALIALAALPPLVLVAISMAKSYYLGLPLTVLDRFMMQGNLVMLAYNDWRVAIVVVAVVVLVGAYFWVLLRGRGRFVRLEQGLAAAFIAGSLACAYTLYDEDLYYLLEKDSGDPTFKNFVHSAFIPGAHFNVEGDVPPDAKQFSFALGAPKGGKPDLFFILQESTFDPQSVDPKYQPKTLFNKSEPLAGPLHVHTVDGGTWLSEFSLLTQVRPQEFGGGGWYVFHQLPGRIERSLFTKVKELGYRTVVIYPVPGFFLNARQFYRSIGAEEFYDPPELGLGKGWNWKIPDSKFYDAVEAKIEMPDDPRPVAVMMLTINQHGPHDMKDPVADYLSRYGDSDKAYGDFLDYLKSRGRRAGVVVFGDHQPQFTETIFSDRKVRELTRYEIRCINFICERPADIEKRPLQLDITLLAPIALEHFGFEIDEASRYERSLFAQCATDVSTCADELRQRFNRAFSIAFK
jgi:hypothetical protein